MIFHLLIVDDEAPIRKGISRFINWDAIDCTIEDTACDGLEAMEKLKNLPIDIVITDIRMPEADGLELARHISEHYPDIKVIILTGYADFTYAQTAIQYNVSDFLLKPISKEQVVTAVQNAQKKIIAGKQRSHAGHVDLSFLKDQLLQELTDRPQDPVLLDRAQEYHIDLTHYCLAAFQMLPPAGDTAALKELVSGQITGGGCYRYNNLILAIVPTPDHTGAVPAGILSSCQELVQIARSMLGIELSVGISLVHHGSGGYGAAVSESIHALTQNFYSPSGIACYDDSLSAQSSYSLTAQEALALNELETALFGRDFLSAMAVINSVFIRMKSGFAKSADAKNMCIMIYYTGLRALAKRGITPPEDSIADRISHSADIFGLESIIREFLGSLQKELDEDGSQSKIVRQAVAYIDSHLPDTLSLDIIAGAIPANPSYLSRTFKKETGQALTEYINLARVEKAKELLSAGGSLTYEVAEQTGFHDPAYFSAIFKKYTGLSPKEYRAGSCYSQQTGTADNQTTI